MKTFIFSAIFLSACFFAVSHAQCTYYTLQAGQSLASLANGNSTLYNILVANNVNINGNVICIPSGYFSYFYYGTSSSSNTVINTMSCTYYVVRTGDSFSSISNGNTALINALVAANPTINSASPIPGQSICIPSGTASSYNLNGGSSTIVTSSCASYYTIKSGDSFYSISNGNSALLSALTAANPTVNSANLQVGQSICIPSGTYNINGASSTVVTSSCASYYTIKSGDTFYSISNGNSALISALTAANPTVSAANLQVGQSICIPSSSAGSYNTYSGTTTNSCTYYAIKAGQTYYSIAGGNSALISQLTAANPNVNPSNLSVGQQICIPSSSYSSFYLY